MLLSNALVKFNSEYCYDRGYSKSTVDNYRFAINILIKVIGDIDVSLVTLDNLRSFRLKMENDGKDRNGIVSYLYKTRLFFTWLAKTNRLSLDPHEIIIPKRRRTIPDYLTVEEIELLMLIASPRERAIISLLYSTAMRVSELCQVRVKDLSRSTIKIRGKGNIERQVQIDESARHYIDMYLRTREDSCPFLFYTKKHRGISIGGVQHILRDLGRKTKIDKPISPKIFRHSTATDMLMNGCNLRYIQVYLGHADISTTQIYTHVADKDANDAYAKYHKKLMIPIDMVTHV